MVMATNLYYHCWFVGARLQDTQLFWLLLMLLFFLFVSPLLLFCCSYPPLPQLHTQSSKHKHKDKRKKGKTGGCWVTQAVPMNYNYL
jgi:hypothetical protein